MITGDACAARCAIAAPRVGPLFQGLCHCRNRQRISGAGHVGFICFAEDAVTVVGETRSYAATGGSGAIAHAIPARAAVASCSAVRR